MSRPIGSTNKKNKPATKTVAVRLTTDELRTLATVHTSVSKAIHELISRHATPRKPAR